MVLDEVAPGHAIVIALLVAAPVVLLMSAVAPSPVGPVAAGVAFLAVLGGFARSWAGGSWKHAAANFAVLVACTAAVSPLIFQFAGELRAR
jgi:hypothetical protein